MIITGRSQAKADKFMATLSKEKGLEPMEFYQVDLSDLNQVARFADIVKAKHKKIDILVNNAGGGFGHYKFSKQGIEANMACNHLAPVYLTSLLLPLMKKAGRARVVNVSSMGHIAYASQFKKYLDDKDIWLNKPHVDYTKDYAMFPVYSLSKFGNVVFAKGLQKRVDELGLDIKSVSVHPGGVVSDFSRFAQKKYALLWKILYPLWRLANVLVMKTEAEGAATSLHCSLAPFGEIEKGAYYSDCHVAKPQAMVEGNVDYFWKDTNRLLKELTGHEAFSL